MSVEPRDMREDDAVAPLIAHAAAARKRAPELVAAMIGDYLLPPAARLTERDRAAIDARLARCAGSVERAILGHADRALRARGETGFANALAAAAPPALARLLDSKLARDPEFMREIIGGARAAALADALPLAPQMTDRASLLPRLSEDTDHAVTAGARALLAADGAHGPFDETADGTGLPAELHHRLTWWVAAIVRERIAEPSETLDTVIADAALHALAHHDEGDRIEAAAARLAALLGARELPPLLVEAVGDRRVALFVALIARSAGVSYEEVRDALLDGQGDRLWLMLRALDCPRDAIARIGLALGHADGRRDVAAFADALNAIMAVPADAAREALAT